MERGEERKKEKWGGCEGREGGGEGEGREQAASWPKVKLCPCWFATHFALVLHYFLRFPTCDLSSLDMESVTV